MKTALPDTRHIHPLLAAIALVGLLACEAAQPPAHFAVVELSGTPYQRGLQHGERFSSKIRSFYTQMLTTSLLPYLNRERPDIASVLLEYQNPIYGDGSFAYQLMLRSGLQLEEDIPHAFIEEMEGIAEGAGVDYKQVLILNTFLDTMVGIRSITFFIRKTQAPVLNRLSFGDLASDGRDNDGDGETDEADEGSLEPFSPSARASMVGVAPDAELVIELVDPDGVNAEGIRIQLNEDLYVVGDSAIESEVFGATDEGLRVHFRPPGGFGSGATHTVQLSAGDNSWVVDPPPARARQMRDQRFVFTTRGDARQPHEVENRGYDDGRSQPPSIAFAARGSATVDGAPLLAHHFALLDSNTSHKHAALFLHRPDEGIAHVTLGWVGIVFGFTGMNAAGLSFGATMADTLDNPLIAEFRRHLVFAELRSSGMPMGMAGREVLATATSAAEAEAMLGQYPPTYGWNVLLADAAGDIRAMEIDAAILDEDLDVGVFAYTPDPSQPGNLDAHGRPWASLGPDDLRMASHYQKNIDDIELELFDYQIEPQRTWSSFYYRSLRSFYTLGDALEAELGALDPQRAQAVLRLPALVDQRDSKIAPVREPAAQRLHYAMGQVPATDGPFMVFDLGEALDREQP